MYAAMPGLYAKAYSIEGDVKSLYREELASVTVFDSSGNYVYVSEEDINLMAQIVYAESRSEPYTGKVAVASVILNRVRDPGFPKTIEGVIKQKGAFSCLKNGEISVTPDESCFKAVLEALKGSDPTNNALFFYNPKIAKSQWMKDVAKTNINQIGNHTFFAVKR